jgi:predicted cupin superfamily sugar epimerase
MNPRIQTLIDSLQLQPHPEGGYYREIFRSDHMVAADQNRAERKALTAIYFLLETGQHSRWHRVLSDEVWTYLEGDPLELLCFDAASARLTICRLGPYAPETEPVRVVPAGVWQAAQPLGVYTLVNCTVGPGFEFSDFSMAADHPNLADVIRGLGDAAGKLI